jgi:hypothetical protein
MRAAPKRSGGGTRRVYRSANRLNRSAPVLRRAVNLPPQCGTNFPCCQWFTHLYNLVGLAHTLGTAQNRRGVISRSKRCPGRAEFFALPLPGRSSPGIFYSMCALSQARTCGHHRIPMVMRPVSTSGRTILLMLFF